jgi:homoserine kinase
METSWSVRVPASTSNLGPGFDLLGLALGLFLDVRVHPSAERVLLRSGEGERELPEAGEDLVLMAF